ncbi:homoserine dehydrogenase, partial [Rothia kristinae]
LAFHAEFTLEDVHCEGITGITAADVAAAQAEGCVIKLLAVCERLEEGVSIRVHPTLVPNEHPLASVRGAFNAVFVHSRDAGQLMFYGPGAGGAPTASAVMGDLVSLARRVVLGGPAVPDFSYAQLPAVGPEDVVSSYTMGLQVKDRLGVLAGMAQVFAEEGVSIRTMHQTKHGPHRGAGQPETTIRVVTHRAADRRVRATIEKLRGLDAVDAITSVIRVED